MKINRKMRTRNRLLFILVAAVMLSCSEAPFYEKVYSFKNKEWKQDQKMKYVVDIQDTEKVYDFTVTLRTTTDYKYNNLWVFMKTIAPDGSSGSVFPVAFKAARDPQHQAWPVFQGLYRPGMAAVQNRSWCYQPF